MRIVEKKIINKRKRGIIFILGKEVEVEAGLIDLPLFCILKLSSRKLVIYRASLSGKKRLVKKIDFLVKNICYG